MRKQYAVIVRLGEKQILESALAYFAGTSSTEFKGGAKRKVGEITVTANLAKKSKR